MNGISKAFSSKLPLWAGILMSAHRAGPTQRAAHQSLLYSGLLHTPQNEDL